MLQYFFQLIPQNIIKHVVLYTPDLGLRIPMSLNKRFDVNLDFIRSRVSIRLMKSNAAVLEQ